MFDHYSCHCVGQIGKMVIYENLDLGDFLLSIFIANSHQHNATGNQSVTKNKFAKISIFSDDHPSFS